MIQIKSFNKEKKYIKEFLNLPYTLYKNDSVWIPPIIKDIRLLLEGKHPCNNFLIQKNFLVIESNSVIGRAVAFINRRVKIEEGFLGTFGLFEMKNNPIASQNLFDEIQLWLKSNGIKTIWGPMNGTMWLSYRCLTDEFNGPTFIGEPYNKSYYPELIKVAGFKVLHKWRSVFSEGKDLEKTVIKTKIRYDRALKAGYTFRSIRLRNLIEELKILYRLIIDSFSRFPGFHIIDEDTFIWLNKGMEKVADPELIKFAVTPDGREIGFVIVFPDYSDAFRAMNGKNNLWAKFKFQFNKSSVKKLVGLYIGVLYEEVRKFPGIGGALGYLSVKKAWKNRIPIVIALMSENSFTSSRAYNEESIVHKYELYDKKI